MSLVARSQKFRRKRREETHWSNPQGLLLAALPFVIMAALLGVFLMRHERFLSERGKLPFAVIPWDASWPELRVANIAGALRDEGARALYAFAGRREDVHPVLLRMPDAGSPKQSRLFREQEGSRWARHRVESPRDDLSTGRRYYRGRDIVD
jgi:hypothetical protein